MVLEVMMLATGYLMWKRKTPSQWHTSLTKPMIILWFLAFLSGEVVYIVYYVLYRSELSMTVTRRTFDIIPCRSLTRWLVSVEAGL
jgi:membrane-anchored protein YejM (alkaline phosphatase superfamily)